MPRASTAGQQALAGHVGSIRSRAPAAAWGRSTEYLKDSVEHFSRRWYPYPYPAAINVAGPGLRHGISGRVLFDGIDDKGKELFWITAHEIGHTWFPMIVGFNERRDAWMDEGFNTFIDIYESDDFKKASTGPSATANMRPAAAIPWTRSCRCSPIRAPIIMTRADAIREKYRHPVTYFKSALGLVLLREQISGRSASTGLPQASSATGRSSIPKPSDFFRAMESEAARI
jgi:hypothetical protein